MNRSAPRSIYQYLRQLREELAGADSAVHAGRANRTEYTGGSGIGRGSRGSLRRFAKAKAAA
jgi:hypothetical protein